VLTIDPYGKEIGLTPPRFKTDMVLMTHEHMDHNNVSSIPGEPFVVRGPGDYEIKEVAITGIPTFHDKSQGKERGRNTVYVIEMEEMRLVHLGDFGESEIRPETLEAIGEVDILFIPVGGTYTIDAETAAEVVAAIEPKIVIPMHYAIPGLKVKLDGASDFLKEMGVKTQSAEERLTIKKKDLSESESTRVVVLKTV